MAVLETLAAIEGAAAVVEAIRIAKTIVSAMVYVNKIRVGGLSKEENKTEVIGLVKTAFQEMGMFKTLQPEQVEAVMNDFKNMYDSWRTSYDKFGLWEEP
jgi:mannose/fructose/N-acetylgalactosamine-specific phosphotransferase system component IIB